MGKRIDFSRLHDRFIVLVNTYMQREQKTQQEVAELIGVNRPHLCLVLNKNQSRPLTRIMIEKCVQMGVFMVQDIYDEKPLTADEAHFWGELKLVQRRDLTKYLYLIEQKGGLDTALSVLKMMAENNTSKK